MSRIVAALAAAVLAPLAFLVAGQAGAAAERPGTSTTGPESSTRWGTSDSTRWGMADSTRWGMADSTRWGVADRSTRWG